jgi:hypothetical protein
MKEMKERLEKRATMCQTVYLESLHRFNGGYDAPIMINQNWRSIKYELIANQVMD